MQDTFTPFVVTSTCKGGGYSYARTEPPHPRRNSKGLYPLHRVLAENMIGRFLEPDEVVHHKDENKENNEESNLEVLTRSEHSREHSPERPLLTVSCGGCEGEIRLKTHVMRQRLSRSKSGVLFCSRACIRS